MAHDGVKTGAEPNTAPAHPQFPMLFSPLTMRGVTLRNRVVMLPMGSRFARDGQPTEADFAFYGARARNGVGMIITGGSSVHPSGAPRGRVRFEPYNQATLPGLAKLAEAIHAEGTAIVSQISHHGRISNGDTEWPPVAPSAIPSPVIGNPQIPHAMTLSEIEDMIEAFGMCAKNMCARAGFDGIEIHAAHGYLISQFLSPDANHRDDRYGGSDANRMQFLLDAIDVVRENAGPDKIVGVRMSAIDGDDFVEGITLPYSEKVAQTVAATGKVDYISVTMGIHGAYVKDMAIHVGAAVPLAAAIRKSSGLPVVAGQRINHPSLAETVLASGAADMIGMARALITDCEWVAKAASGRAEEIRPCIACNQVCRSGIMGCVHSPGAGRETVWGPGSLTKASSRRKVVVVGGGPGGLEAAIIAAERGHDVVLFEASKKLGGQARIAALAPNRTEVDGVVSYRSLELNRLNVDIRLGVRADRDVVLAQKPDAVVIAAGATFLPIDIEGGELPHVISVTELFEPGPDARERINNASSAVVIDNGSGFWEICSAAEYLGTLGLQVHFLTPAPALAANLPSESISPLLRRLRSLGVIFLPMHRALSIEAGQVLAYDAVRVAATQVLEEQTLPADIVVHFSGKAVVADLAAQLAGRVPEIHMVGDCISPRRINHAVLEGHKIGRAL